ncbi:Piwi domain-containing protein [Lentzea sp. NPDC003310]|uniref:argonaute/piwi family protein n=1 Tax=Lentzea sp. NPDC003310 TaxID=3154447 RepID=UPI0033B0EAD2
MAFNFMPVRFSAEKFEGGLVPFESRDQLVDLRSKLDGTHVVARTRDGIACVPLAPGVGVHGAPTTFSTRDYQTLTMLLVREALVRAVLGWGYKLRRRYPVEFVSRLQGKDLLAPLIGRHGQDALRKLHVYPRFLLDSKTIGPANCPGVVVGLRTRLEIDMTVAELIQRGVDVEGLYVLGEDSTAAAGPEMDHYAAREIVGAVDRVDEGQLMLRDAVGVTQIEAAAAWLEPRRETFHDLITTFAGVDAVRINRELERATFDLLGAFGRFERTVDIASRLARRGALEIAADLSATVEPLVGSSNGRKPSFRRYDSPTLRFDQAGDRYNRSADRGLDDHGPFDSEFFQRKKPKIVVVAPRQYMSEVKNFMAKFLNGVEGAKVFQKGFLRKYRLAGHEVAMHPFDGQPTDASAYREACRSALKAGNVDLAIVITSEAQRHLAGDASPYFVSKSIFMGHGVPVQDVKVETVRLSKLAYPLNSIALASYAKLGGIPFLIATAGSEQVHELVIGIGSAEIRASRMAPAERVVGITTVFSADGNYLLSNTSREADYDDYPQELLRSLTDAVNAVRDRNIWRSGDKVRLVFHVFKPIKDVEATAVKELVERLTSEHIEVEFAFLHVSTEHEWRMFDRAGAGVANWGGAAKSKGQYVADRGYAVPIGDREVLLAVRGPMDLKSDLHGAPKPLSLKLHRKSTFTDMDFLTGQVFSFTSMSWRNIYPSHLPVTILYSDLIADLLGNLRHVKNWNADSVATRLHSSKWFL